MIKISSEEKITSIGRRGLDICIHSSMPNGIVTEGGKQSYSWNCADNQNKSVIPRGLPSFPVRVNRSSISFAFE